MLLPFRGMDRSGQPNRRELNQVMLQVHKASGLEAGRHDRTQRTLYLASPIGVIKYLASRRDYHKIFGRVSGYQLSLHIIMGLIGVVYSLHYFFVVYEILHNIKDAIESSF